MNHENAVYSTSGTSALQTSPYTAEATSGTIINFEAVRWAHATAESPVEVSQLSTAQRFRQFLVRYGLYVSPDEIRLHTARNFSSKAERNAFLGMVASSAVFAIALILIVG